MELASFTENTYRRYWERCALKGDGCSEPAGTERIPASSVEISPAWKQADSLPEAIRGTFGKIPESSQCTIRTTERGSVYVLFCRSQYCVYSNAAELQRTDCPAA